MLYGWYKLFHNFFVAIFKVRIRIPLGKEFKPPNSYIAEHHLSILCINNAQLDHPRIQNVHTSL